MTGDSGLTTQNYERALKTSLTDTALLVHSVGDLHTLCDVYDTDENGYGSYTFERSTFSFIDSDDNIYYGYTPIKRTLLSIKDVNNHLERIPDKDIYPEVSSRITVVFIHQL